MLTTGAFGLAGYDAAAAVVTDTSDAASQYGFDLGLACLFSLLADARLERSDSAACSQRLGERLLALMPPPTDATAVGRATAPPKLSEILGGMRALLDQLRAAGYVASWSLDDSDADEALWGQRSALSTTRLSVTLNDTASLRAALLLNGRAGSSPELAKPLLCAYLRARGVEVTEASDYFLDSVYRSSPLEYRPNQQILSLTLSPGTA